MLTDVFISYSRKDAEFVGKLNTMLTNSKQDVWIDWEDIPFSAKWWDEITRAIDGASTFLCVISPDFQASNICQDELAYAEKLNKRIIPVLHRDINLSENKSNSIAKINWLYFRNSDDFNTSFEQLLTTISKDLEWVRFHTRLLVRANEWATNKNDQSFHLFGKDLEDADSMIDRNKGKMPELTLLQQNYIASSQSGAVKLQRKQLKGFYLAALVYTIVNLGVIYIWAFDDIGESGLIKLSWAWLPAFSFSIAGFTIGKNSLRASFIVMLVVCILFFFFYNLFWTIF